MDLEEFFGQLKDGFRRDPSSLSFSADQLTSFSDFGLRSHTFKILTESQVNERFAEVRKWVQFAGEGAGLNAAYLDTTTLYTVERLLLNREPPTSPWALLDLATFVNSAVLFDQIFHLQTSHVNSLRIDEALGNERIVLELPVSSFMGGFHGDSVHSLGAILRGMWYETKEYLDLMFDARDERDLFNRDLKEFGAAWQTLLDLPSLNIDLLKGSHWSVANDSWSSDGPALIAELVEAENADQRFAVKEHVARLSDPDRVQADLYTLIAECNYRSLFNQRVAGLLRLPYLPNSFRMPFRGYLYRQAKIVRQELPALGLLERKYQDKAAAFFSDKILQLPFFLSAVLAKISNLGEFFEALSDIRAKAARFRKVRAELDTQVREGNVKLVTEIRAALDDESSLLRGLLPKAASAGAIAAVLPLLGSSTTPLIVASVGLLTLASQFPAEKIRALMARIMAPEFWFLPDLNASASEIMNAYPKICRLWNWESRDPQRMAEQLGRIGTIRY